MHTISLRHVHADGRPFSAIEDIAALGSFPNGRMTARELRECREFRGTEAEAVALR